MKINSFLRNKALAPANNGALISKKGKINYENIASNFCATRHIAIR
jgi:hypothetical protein